MTTSMTWKVPDFDQPESGRLGEIKALFADIYPQGDYGTLAQLANPDGSSATPPFVDEVLGMGLKHGYSFRVIVTQGSATTVPSYICLASPVAPGSSGYRMYFVDESGVIRYTADGSVPNATSPPLM